MSDFWINLSLDETAQKKAPVGKLNRKKEWLHRNRHHCGAKGYKEGKHNNQYREDFRQSQTLQNGASIECPPPSTSTQNKSLPCLASASHSSSMPPFGEKPKEPLKSAASSPGSSVSSTCKPITMSSGNPSKYVAIDCEMVGTGPKRLSELARCSIVSYEGDVIYDQFIQPSAQVTDYRTRWSGIRRRDLVNAMPFAQARMEILSLIKGKVVVGHAIHNDFKVIGYCHPPELTRDTSRIPLLNQMAGIEGNKCTSLKTLTKAIFNRDIQTGNKGHSSVEDARAAMELYKVVEHEWERQLAANSMARVEISSFSEMITLVIVTLLFCHLLTYI
ncbi:interferon-stimulated 20 kDa exonuclease-like 2 [Oreochromis niloticus]|uniref:Interferon-stimulated 20 kDa exonuclease-like 2 n=2 Tax=Oreochromis TaxID=8139 RepID=A0A669E7Y7_ORENI|nr:interferon-stimulated 20 kDa exonuclease-like 2 [Oreochromis niloticus]XP_031601809.2 interferon-stimulated 20 kDa exonuclease-like 2 [Oreochromis aureus]CAI5662035.1 unnamed protein product [Mustela putorius furo]